VVDVWWEVMESGEGQGEGVRGLAPVLQQGDVMRLGRGIMFRADV
jgi:hypothetical protein